MSTETKLHSEVNPRYHNEDNPSDKVWLATICNLMLSDKITSYIKDEKFRREKISAKILAEFFSAEIFSAESFSAEIYSAEIVGFAEICSAETFGCPICRKTIILDGLTFPIFNEPLQSKHARLEYSSPHPWTNE